MYANIAKNISHSESEVATPQPIAPSCGMPNLPYMKIQLPITFAVRPRKPKYMIGRVRPRPSLVKRSAKNAISAGMPQVIACTYPTAVGRISGAIPSAGNTRSTCRRPVTSTTASASATHQA